MCMYIAFALFALMNIVTGVFVETALQTAKTDRDVFMLHSVRSLFKKLDKDGSGAITWDEFMNAMKAPEMPLFFEAMDLSVGEAGNLFSLLDINQTGEVAFDDFTYGCFRLRGQAKAMDLASLMAEQNTFIARFEEHAVLVEGILSMLMQSHITRRPEQPLKSEASQQAEGEEEEESSSNGAVEVKLETRKAVQREEGEDSTDIFI